MPKSFADYPKSVAEVRADRSRDGADWTPRDALIDLLREIDSGRMKPVSLVIAWRETTDDGLQSGHSSACQSGHDASGLLARALHRVNLQMDT